ncbi:hypothetical protein ZIOFF_022611 [Zingiber officinale]|uniref:SCP domain-containing protein n=1 Tax=Zingiber officinale TaxID=94328 RepID=A0A8J5LHC1_ZINOF|nr:hypothetical protein ZIOFF_022611 [Zingiber officinale]
MLALLCAAALALATAPTTTMAQNSPQDFVDAHNSARSAVGVGPVSWDDTVAAYAQSYAEQRIGDCQLVHSGGPYGENLFGGSGADWTAADAVGLWVGEQQYYDYDSNSCAAGQWNVNSVFHFDWPAEYWVVLWPAKKPPAEFWAGLRVVVQTMGRATAPQIIYGG